MTHSPGTCEATQALRAGEMGLGSAGCNIPTGAAGRTASEMEARGLWRQARPSRGSLRHAHLLLCLEVTRAGISQRASSHRPSICHDAPGKNTVKYYFFIPFITLTKRHLEAPLAPSGKTQPTDSMGTPTCPRLAQGMRAFTGHSGPGLHRAR